MQSAPSPRHAQVTICPAEDTLRLDYWLARRFTYHSRQYWQREISRGRIRINSRQAKSARKLRVGDKIEYLFPEFPEPPVDSRLKIIIDDDDILIVNKPGNLPCHPAGKYFRNTLWHLLKTRLNRFWILNRLDRETSGVVLIAKTKDSARHLYRQFSSRSIQKKYHVLVEGNFPKNLTAEGYLTDDTDSPVRKKQRFDAGGDLENGYVLTYFNRLDTCAGVSLVQAVPKTGKYHQIRATLSSLGFPVVGDKLYGVDDQLYLRQSAGTLDESDYSVLKLERQALHAIELTYQHPCSENMMTVSADYPPDLSTFLRRSGFECAGHIDGLRSN